jgi:hypothetical protein
MEESFNFCMVTWIRILGGIVWAGTLFAQIENVRVVGTTSTQAVLSYTAPDEGPCSLEVGENANLQPNLHDINGNLFPEASIDSRPGSVGRGRERLVVIGRRTAEKALDGRRYSRAMAANTEYHFAISCGDAVVRGQFTTKNIPAGVNVSDPLPSDPERPGEYAWPSLDWTGRNVQVIDPLTGLRLHRITSPTDKLEISFSPFRDVYSLDNSWLNARAALLDSDNNAFASHVGSSTQYLMLDAKQGFYQGGTHDNDGNGLAFVQVKLNAWCEDRTCNEASPEERTLEACLTVNGVSCSTQTLEAVVAPCSRNCSGDRERVIFGDQRPMLAAWGTDLNFDISHAQNRSGVVRREGNVVQWRGGHKFSLLWTAGSRIVINGVAEQILRVDSEERLTLERDAPVVQEEVRYEASNFGVLVRRKVGSLVQFNLQYAWFDFAMASGILWDASGDGESQTSCTDNLVAGPDGEMGYHCAISNSLYWLGEKSGRVSNLGVAQLPERTGTVDGWRGGYCDGVFWDATEANTFYCKGTDRSTPSNDILLRVTYRGDNRDVSPTGTYDRQTECNATASNQPCVTISNLTPSSTQRTLTTQLRAFHPEARSFVVRSLGIVGRQGRHLILMARRDFANDTMGFIIAFDLAQARIVAATPSWKSWPLRWAGLHGGASIGSPEWAFVPAAEFRGPATGVDWAAGNGPYRTRVTSGVIPTAGQPCPVRPANSLVSGEDWPAGSNCVTVSVEGEPCDSSPAAYSTGRVRVVGGNATIVGLDTGWTASQDGLTIIINGKLYGFTYLSATSARLSPPPEESFEGAYLLALEPINNSKCGNPLHAYLQDAEPGDLFCGNPNANGTTCGLYNDFEWFRLLVKSGNTWTLQRRVGESGRMRQHPAGTMLIAYPPTCTLGKIYPCGTSVAYWQFLQDPFGRNAERSTIIRNGGDPPTGHGSLKPGLEVFSVANEGCPQVDGEGYSCYGFRRGPFAEIFRQPFSLISNNPTFRDRLGLGSPNAVDSHPTVPLLSQLENVRQKNWFLDARPVLGDGNFSGSRQSPARRLSGDLYRFRRNQISRLRRQQLPTMAFCGHNPLQDISGPGSVIDGTDRTRFSYCIAEKDGECQTDSEAGDAYVNCPQMSRPHCQYSGVGSANSDLRDICLGDNGAYNQAVIQVGVDSSNLSGSSGRILTYALSRYRFIDPFWNVKLTPDGQWMLIRVPWIEGKRAEVLAARVPPMPEEEAPVTEMSVAVTPPESLNATQVAVEFGYTPQFYCTSRQEACVRAAHGGSGYSFASLPWQPQACTGSCEMTLPVVPNRVIYWRARYFDADGKEVGESATGVGVTTR